MNQSMREAEQGEWYARNYTQAGDRNDLRTNRGVLFQTLASEASFVSAFLEIAIPPRELRVLDVGCGSGAFWYQLFRLGVIPRNVVGIEVQKSRLDHAADLYPQANAIHGDATCMPFEKDSFDLVYESTLFTTLTDHSVREKIAREMMRVCKPDGYLLLVDWRTNKPWDGTFRALNRKELTRLFRVGETCKLVRICPGALVPPLGRFLSKYL